MIIFSQLLAIGFYTLIISSAVLATDTIHSNCDGTIPGQGVYAANYANFTQCTARMDADSRTMQWGIDGIATSIIINPAMYEISGDFLINTSINEIATFNGNTYNPALAANSNEPVFAALPPRLDGEDDIIYYEGLITKYPTTIDGVEYYDQLRMGNSGRVFATDGTNESGTRALMIPLRSVAEYQSFIDSIDTKYGPAPSTGTGYLSAERATWRCQRSLDDIPFGSCAPPVSLADLAEQFTALFVNIDYCTYIPVWRLSKANFQEVEPGWVEVSFKVALEDSGIAQQSYSIELLMLKNDVDADGDVIPMREPCTRNIAIFPNFYNPANNQYHRLVYTDYSLLNDVFLTTFPGLSHKTYDMVGALDNDDESFMFIFSYKGPHTSNLVHLDRPGWPQVNEARIRMLQTACCSHGNLHAEPVFPNLNIGGITAPVNQVVALRDESTSANQTLAYDALSQTWQNSDASIIITPRAGLTSGYDWLLGSGFSVASGRVDLPAELDAASFYTVNSFQNNRYYRLYPKQSKNFRLYSRINMQGKGNSPGFPNNYLYYVSPYWDYGVNVKYSLKSCGFNWRPNNTGGSSGTETHYNIYSALGNSSYHKNRCFAQPNKRIDAPYGPAADHPLIDPTHTRPNPDGGYLERIIYGEHYFRDRPNLQWPEEGRFPRIQPPNSIEGQSIIGAHFLVFPTPSPEQYFATDDFLEAIGYLPGTTIPANRLFHNKFTEKCDAKSCTYELSKLYP